MRILVLGGGLVGSAIARDLASDTNFKVSVADVNEDVVAHAATYGARGVYANLASPDTVRILAGEADLVIGSLPGFMGFSALRAVIEAGRNIVDISFLPENSLELDELARERGVTAVVDCGLAPGLGNVLMGRATRELDSVHSFLCYVGGLPAVRRKPFEYAAVFSPVDVIEEYTRPARYLEDGVLVTRPALSDVELLDFPGVGTLEAFNTDGLRSLALTMPAPNMKEKTMRYPGHAELMRVLRDTGYFSKEEIDVRGTRVRPLDVTAQLLFPAWKLPEGDEDVSIMRVIITGEKNGTPVRREYNLLDRYDRSTRTTSMARTTGYTCAVAARLVADGTFSRKGVSPPEYIGHDATADAALMSGLQERGVLLQQADNSLHD